MKFLRTFRYLLLIIFTPAVSKYVWSLSSDCRKMGGSGKFAQIYITKLKMSRSSWIWAHAFLAVFEVTYRQSYAAEEKSESYSCYMLRKSYLNFELFCSYTAKGFNFQCHFVTFSKEYLDIQYSLRLLFPNWGWVSPPAKSRVQALGPHSARPRPTQG